MTRKDRQLNLRVSEEQRTLFERAAELEGVPVSTLVLGSAEERAQEIVRTHTSVTVPAEVFDALLGALDEPARNLAPALDKALDELPSIVGRR